MVHGSSQDLQAYLTSLLTDERVKAICRHRVLCRTLAGNCCDLLTVTNFGVSQAEMETRKVRMGQRWWWWWWWWWHGFHCVGLEEMGNFFSLQVQWRQKAAESSKLPPLWLRASHLISSQLWEGGGGGGLFSLFSRLDQFLWPAFSFHVRWVLYSCLVIPRAGCHYYSPRASGRNKRIVDDERIH